MVSRDIRHPALSSARVFSTKEEYVETFKYPPATFSLFLSHFFAVQRYLPTSIRLGGDRGFERSRGDFESG